MNKTFSENKKRKDEDWAKKNETRQDRIKRYELKVADEEKEARKNIKVYLK